MLTDFDYIIKIRFELMRAQANIEQDESSFCSSANMIIGLLRIYMKGQK
jgi:hypothetical protein